MNANLTRIVAIEHSADLRRAARHAQVARIDEPARQPRRARASCSCSMSGALASAVGSPHHRIPAMPSYHAESDLGTPVVWAEGERLAVRPLEVTDRDAFAALFDRLSPDSRFRRFHGPKPVLAPRELTYLTDVDHLRHEALAAIDKRDGSIVGVSRYVARVEEPQVADLAIEVADDMQGIGIGTLLAQADHRSRLEQRL